ncbi:MAG: membrane dipeptidase, partial [Verrucomicrobiales bacterium]
MNRRAFVSGLAASAGLANSLIAQPPAARRPEGRDRLIMDAMGELRPEYEPALIRQMLSSGLDSITITLCDPKPEGAQALELAVDSLFKHDRFLAKNPEFFLKATSVRDVETARRLGKMAVFYLYQNTVQFGQDLDRIDMFHGLGLRNCQLTYNTRNHVGVG